MHDLPDPDWYLDHVLVHAEPGDGGRVAPGPVATWSAWWEMQRAASSHPAMTAAAQRGFVLTSAALAELGVPRHEVRRRVHRGEWWVPQRGAVAPVHPGNDGPAAARRRHALRVAAALHLNPYAVAGHRSGAILSGLPTFAIPGRPELIAPREAPTNRWRPSELPERDRWTWFGAPVTSVARTVVDLARHDRRDGLMAADAAFREHLTDRAGLTDVLDRQHRWRGVRAARDVLALADGLAESPLESLTRLAIHDSGLPPPELQVEIAVPGRSRRYRVDLLWSSAGLILECDGREKYDADALWREKRRENDLRRAGYRVERVVWADVVRRWDVVRAMLAAAL